MARGRQKREEEKKERKMKDREKAEVDEVIKAGGEEETGRRRDRYSTQTEKQRGELIAVGPKHV